ncbi:hypothetical protein GYMLUDRAFT_178139, partial [Collybiopsis luxurians FD-317 M1]
HGPMLLGTFLALILYGISITQIYLYWASHWKKSASFCFIVVLVFLVDSVHTVFIMAYLYLSLIKHFGNVSYITSSTWLFASGMLMMGVATSIASQIVKLFQDFQEFQVVVILWAITAMITDLVIMAILILHLRQSRTGFRSTDTHIDRIIRCITISLGMITVIWDLAHLLTYELDPTGIHLFFNFTLAKLYTNALLSALSSRGGWKFLNSDKASSTQQTIYNYDYGANQHVCPTLILLEQKPRVPDRSWA